MVTEHHRGNPIMLSDGRYVYSDTKQPVPNNPDRNCGYCGLSNTVEGHDGCLGILPNTMNACCGHGDVNDAYVQFLDGACQRKGNAYSFFNKYANGRKNKDQGVS